MKKTIHSAVAVFVTGSLLATQALAAGTVPGYGAAGVSNPAIAAIPLGGGAVDNSTATAGSTSTAATASTAGFTATQIGVAAVVVAGAATAIALGASGGGSSSSSHSSASHH